MTDISKGKLVEDLKSFADELGKSPTRMELNEHGPHYVKLYQKEFGSWNNALEAAGLEVNLVHDISRQELLDDIERVAGVLGKAPTLDEIDRYGKYSKTTYKQKLQSYVKALEELGLEPSVTQYNFSEQEKPQELQGTKNVRKLKKNGPTPASELPTNSTGATDKKYGLTKFRLNTGQAGKGFSEPVYYLFDEHEPEAVIRKFIQVNPQILDNRSIKGIVEEAGNHGNAWSSAARKVLADPNV